MTRKLPVGTCIRHAVNSVRNNISYAFRISWPWYAAIAVLSIAVFAGLGVLAAGGVLSALHFGVVFLVAISFVAFAAIAVNWHRYILLDEVPTGGSIFRLDGHTWRYLGNLLLIGLILFLISAVIMGPLIALAANLYSDSVIIAVVIVGLVFFMILAIFSVRLSVKLPAVALGRRDFTFSHALAATRGNSLPVLLLILFQVALALGTGMLMFFLEFVTGAIHPIFGFVTGLLAQLFVNWILTIFGITILTSLYGFFAEGRDF